MVSDLAANPPAFLPAWDDEIVALTIQLEQLRTESAHNKGKYTEGQPPDATRALLEQQTELATCLQTLTDLKLAHSIAHAVDTDGPAIANLISIETQANEDRKTALQLSTDDPELESPAAPPPYEEIESTQNFQSLVHRGSGELPAADDARAMTYAQHQEAVIEAFSSRSTTCCACSEAFRPGDVFRLKCNDTFCRPCLTRVVQLAMHDKSMFPPKCHRQAIPEDIICALLSEHELEDFRNTEIEVSCIEKTYCSNNSCGRFIAPTQITADRALCTRCGASTCTNCKNAFHNSDCAEDPLLQATLALAEDEKWQRCFACRAVVILAEACNHIT